MAEKTSKTTKKQSRSKKPSISVACEIGAELFELDGGLNMFGEGDVFVRSVGPLRKIVIEAAGIKYYVSGEREVVIGRDVWLSEEEAESACGKMRSKASKKADTGSLKNLEIYTDGACAGNPGSGGWCCIIVDKDNQDKGETVLSGGERKTTNNRMELMGAIAAFESLRSKCDVVLTSDSKYLVDAFEQHWIDSWKQNGWMRGDTQVPNADLWKRLLVAMAPHRVSFVWVKGHSGHQYNEKCDKIASQEAEFYGR